MEFSADRFASWSVQPVLQKRLGIMIAIPEGRLGLQQPAENDSC